MFTCLANVTNIAFINLYYGFASIPIYLAILQYSSVFLTILFAITFIKSDPGNLASPSHKKDFEIIKTSETEL